MGRPKTTIDPMPPDGCCLCGCGQPLRRAIYPSLQARYIHGHRARKPGLAYTVDRETGCWLWLRGADRDGYGKLTRNRRSIRAHVAFYEDKYGPVPEGMVLDHFRCDNPRCCNPDHVHPVTNANNIRRGRVATITLAQAREIRELAGTVTQREIGRRYGLTQSTVSMILTGHNWKEHES